MSLFKARECWLTQCGIDETFDSKSLLVTSLTSEYDYIILGSHSGILRIYQPSLLKVEDGPLDRYKPTDLLIEKQLPHSILQISKGRLVSGNQVYHLALLHPRSVGVYSLICRSGATDSGNQNNVVLVYEHNLKRSTSDLVIGPFGGSQTRDFICVQSLDGMLTFFEQETFAFCCFLPNFLLPGPIVYISTTDCFVTCGSNWYIESYSYKRLSEIGQNSNQNDTVGEKFEADWYYNVGEDILQLEVVKLTTTEYCVVVLGERNLFCLTEKGNLIYMKRFDFSPYCFYPYFMGWINKMMLLVISETNTLLIYENGTLRWSARLSVLPTAVATGTFPGIRGAQVFLTDEGALQVCYLGTEPSLFTAPPLVNKELNFEKVEEELTTLNKIIKQSRNNDVKVTNATTERELVVTLNIEKPLQLCQFEHEPPLNLEQEVQMCLISVELLPTAPFIETQISLTVQHPLKVEPNVHFINNLEDRVKFISYVYQKEKKEVSSLEVRVVVTDITRVGVPRIITKSMNLPLKLVMVPCPPAKESLHKITLNIDHTAPPLATLFPEYVGDHSLTLTSNAIGFTNVLGSGSPVTILLAKSSSRYRLQSDSMASLNLLAHELVTRLHKHFEDTTDFTIKHNSLIPTNQFLEIIEKHFNKNKEVLEIQNGLNDLATQYRLIQKRLIAKFKDRNPTSLNNLDKLMLETHNEILQNSENLVQVTEELSDVQCELGCVLQLILLLIKHAEVPEEIFKRISCVFLTPVQSLENQSWEDVMEACICHLLRTVLAKSDKDKLKSAPSSSDRMTDVTKFKKHVSQVIDRLAKEGSLLESQNSEEHDETEDLTDAEALKQQMGSKIAEYSVRAKSAKLTKPKLVSIADDNEDVVENVE